MTAERLSGWPHPAALLETRLWASPLPCLKTSLVFDQRVLPDTDVCAGALGVFALLELGRKTLRRASWEHCSLIPHCLSWLLRTLGAGWGALKNQGDEFNLFSHCALTLAPTSVRYLTHILCLCMCGYRKKAFDCLLPPFLWHRALNSNNRENNGTGGQVFARIGAHSHTISPVTQLVSWWNLDGFGVLSANHMMPGCFRFLWKKGKGNLKQTLLHPFLNFFLKGKQGIRGTGNCHKIFSLSWSSGVLSARVD